MKKDNKIKTIIGGIIAFWIIFVLSIIVGINMEIIGSILSYNEKIYGNCEKWKAIHAGNIKFYC